MTVCKNLYHIRDQTHIVICHPTGLHVLRLISQPDRPVLNLRTPEGKKAELTVDLDDC